MTGIGKVFRLRVMYLLTFVMTKEHGEIGICYIGTAGCFLLNFDKHEVEQLNGSSV